MEVSQETRIQEQNPTDWPKIAIIILNWNGWKDTIECLESLYQITYPNYGVILIDNGSEDESIEKIKEYCDGKIKVESKFFEFSSENKPIKIIEYTREEAEAGGGREKEIADLPSNKRMIIINNEKNYGFAGGNNIGMRYSLKALNPDYVLLLNNDTVVDKDFLTELIKVAESDERIGIAGCKLINLDGQVQYIGDYMGPYFHEYLRPYCNKIKILRFLCNKIFGYRLTTDAIAQLNEILELDEVCGATMLVKCKIIEKIGLLDEDFFPGYGEETDWCYRARMSGFKVIYNPNAVVIHYGESTSKKLESNYLYFIRKKNSLRCGLLNHPISWLILGIPSHIISFFGAVLQHRLKYWLKAYWVNFTDLRNILTKRKNRKSRII